MFLSEKKVQKTYPHQRKKTPWPLFFLTVFCFSGQIKHELEMCELRRYFENYCREIEAKYRHELEDTVLSSSRITRTLPAITRSFILPNYLVLWSRKYFFWLRLLHEHFRGLWISFLTRIVFLVTLKITVPSLTWVLNYVDWCNHEFFSIKLVFDKIVRSRSQSRNT
jgi:hypothetical protein